MSEQFDPKELENALKGNIQEDVLRDTSYSIPKKEEENLTPDQQIDLEGLTADMEDHLPNWKFEINQPSKNEVDATKEDNSEEKAA